MSFSLTGFMDSPSAAKHYPETVYPANEQRVIFEYTLGKLLATIDDPERRAEKRRVRVEKFAAGQIVYVDRSKLVNALVKAGEILDKKDVAGVRFAEIDFQPKSLTIARVAGSGRWVVLTNEAAEVADLG